MLSRFSKAAALTAFAAAALAAPSTAAADTAAGSQPWNHDPQSPAGPAHWQDTWKTCAPGGHQSPIAIDTVLVQGAPLQPLHVTARPARLKVENTGHDAKVATRAATTVIDGTRYTMAQFHFHAPAEHVVDGKRADLEAHFVHEGPGGRVAVVAVMFDTAKRSSPLLGRILNRLPATAGRTASLGSVDPARLIASAGGARKTRQGARVDRFYRYLGSLTTPDCSGGVTWSVLHGRGGVSARALERYHEVIGALPGSDGHRDNNRPVQPLEDRTVTTPAGR